MIVRMPNKQGMFLAYHCIEVQPKEFSRSWVERLLGARFQEKNVRNAASEWVYERAPEHDNDPTTPVIPSLYIFNE